MKKKMEEGVEEMRQGETEIKKFYKCKTGNWRSSCLSRKKLARDMGRDDWDGLLEKGKGGKVNGEKEGKRTALEI